MTMALAFRHLPPEIEAARQTIVAACREAMPTQRARSSRVLLYLVTFLLGIVIGTLLILLNVVSPTDKELWRAGLTAVSMLSGFMVATMVFTGKIEVAKSLSLIELRDVASKSTHLLLYQFGTLVNHLACLAGMFVAPSIAMRWPVIAEPMASACLALFFVSIVRSIFLPLQIIELHRFTHAALLREKRDEAKKSSEGM